MSVSGFKIFDPEMFPHECYEGRYALMSEIGETQQGQENFHTHVTRIDTHGIPLAILRLFSTPGVDYLLQDTNLNDERYRLLYNGRNIYTYDNFNRKCELSYMILTSKEEESILNKLSYLICIEGDTFVFDCMSKILSKKEVDSKLVLLYNKLILNELLEYVKNKETRGTKSPIINGLLSDSHQIVVYQNENQLGDLYKELPNVFNCESYWQVPSKYIPVKDYPIVYAPLFFNQHSDNVGLKRVLDKGIDTLIRIINNK